MIIKNMYPNSKETDIERSANNQNLSSLTVLVILIFLIQGFKLAAQEITSINLEQCTQLAIENSAANAQKNILEDALKEDVKIKNTAYLPSIDLNGRASYQSDVTKIPIEIPGVEELSKDQYRAALDFQQLIFDGGFTKKQKALLETKYKKDHSGLDLALLELRDRISKLYLTVLLVEENLKLTKLKREDLVTQRANLQSLYNNGTALKSSIDILDAELLKVDQKMIELKTNKQTNIDILASLTGKTLPSDVNFKIPEIELQPMDDSERPEYKMFDAQVMSLQNQAALIDSKNMPKIFLYGSGGYGRPGLNMLDNNFDPFYLAGIKLTMSLSNWSSTKHEKKLAIHQESVINEKRKDFALQNSIQLNKQLSEIEMYKQLISNDYKIIEKRKKIKETEAYRLEKGVSTSNDYIMELNAENLAMQNLKLHQIQLIQAILNYNLLLGK